MPRRSTKNGVRCSELALTFGATVVVVGLKMKMVRGVAMSLGAGACFVLRMVAAWQHWNLPRVMVR